MNKIICIACLLLLSCVPNNTPRPTQPVEAINNPNVTMEPIRVRYNLDITLIQQVRIENERVTCWVTSTAMSCLSDAQRGK